MNIFFTVTSDKKKSPQSRLKQKEGQLNFKGGTFLETLRSLFFPCVKVPGRVPTCAGIPVPWTIPPIGRDLEVEG